MKQTFGSFIKNARIGTKFFYKGNLCEITRLTDLCFDFASINGITVVDWETVNLNHQFLNSISIIKF